MKVKFEVLAKNHFASKWIKSLGKPETVAMVTEFRFDDEDVFDSICNHVRAKGVKDTVIRYRSTGLVPYSDRTIVMEYYVYLTTGGNVYAVWKDDDVDGTVATEQLVLWFDGARNSLSQFGFFALLGASPFHVAGKPDDTFEMRKYEEPCTDVEPDLQQVGKPEVLKTTEPKWHWYENEMLYLIRLHKELEASWPKLNDSQKAMSTSPDDLIRSVWRKVVDYISKLDTNQLSYVANEDVPYGIFGKVGFLVAVGLEVSMLQDTAKLILEHKEALDSLIEGLKELEG